MTSRYNIYFNGRESFKKGEKKIEKNVTDDYTRLIPVFPYSAEAASSATSDMDRTIKKSTKVAALHSITVKPWDQTWRGKGTRIKNSIIKKNLINGSTIAIFW